MPLANSLPQDSVVTGQVKVAVTGTPVQFPQSALKNGLLVVANPTNSGSVIVGPSTITNAVDGTGNGFVLGNGTSPLSSSVNINVGVTQTLYLNGTAGDWVTFIGN